MKLPTILIAAFMALHESAFAYQVNPDNKWTQKTVIDKRNMQIRQPSIASKPTQKQSTALRSSTLALPNEASATTSEGGCAGLFPADPPCYWFNGRIHVFGNTGLFGGLHAAVATLATKIIDMAAYDGRNVREHICDSLQIAVSKSKPRIVDLCSGVGISTRALEGAFPNADSIVGIDTSPEMVSMAKMLSSESMLDKMARVIANASRKKSVFKSPTYKVANAEQTELPSGSADLVTIMYGFHEIPYHGRQRILYEARRILAPGGTLAIVDISKDYEPSPSMLAGEPYVLEYQQNIDRQLEGMSGFQDLSCKAVIPGHVTVWMLRKTGDDGQIIWRQQVPSSTVLDRMESFV